MTEQIYVYRIVTDEEWNQLCRDGFLAFSPLDQQDGFVHLSTKDTVLETARLYYSNTSQPRVLKMRGDTLGAPLRFEPVAKRGGMLFPHYYGGPLKGKHIEAVALLESGAQGFSWGDDEKYDNGCTV